MVNVIGSSLGIGGFIAKYLVGQALRENSCHNARIYCWREDSLHRL